MANNNDERIIKLKKQIDEKRKELKKKNSRFTPITNCVLELDGLRYNLHLQSTPMLMMKLHMLQMAADDLREDYPNSPFGDVQISGYKISDWIADIAANLEIQAFKAEKQKLDKLEKQLTELLSNDKQTELMIDELEALI